MTSRTTLVVTGAAGAAELGHALAAALGLPVIESDDPARPTAAGAVTVLTPADDTWAGPAAEDGQVLIRLSADPAAPAQLRLHPVLSTAQQLSRVLRHLGVHREVSPDSPVLGRRFAAGLFDLDGTLVDSTAAVHRSWELFGREYGLEGDLLESGHGRPAVAIVRSAVPAGEVERALARITEIEESDLVDVVAIPGSAEVFVAVPRRAIVTSGKRGIAAGRISAAGLPRPEVVITFDDVAHGKPHPEPFLRAAELLGVPAADCVVFEDAPAGITAAKAAGCAVVAITGSHEPAELAEADLVVDRLDQLEILVDGEGFRLAVHE